MLFFEILMFSFAKLIIFLKLKKKYFKHFNSFENNIISVEEAAKVIIIIIIMVHSHLMLSQW
jgi:hypothetical protein